MEPDKIIHMILGFITGYSLYQVYICNKRCDMYLDYADQALEQYARERTRNAELMAELAKYLERK